MRALAEREVLPGRRRCETLAFRAGQIIYTATVGYYEDGRVGEVFLNGGKIASETDVAARDSAVALSIALQHGVALEAVRSALTRRGDGSPEGPMGILLDILADVGGAPLSSALKKVVAVPPLVEVVGPPNARGRRYPLEMNTEERSMLSADLQQIYEWHESPRKWIMQEKYRSEFVQGLS